MKTYDMSSNMAFSEATRDFEIYEEWMRDVYEARQAQANEDAYYSTREEIL